ncbi:hypothetical protein HHK36_003296 [Tetracentron sinense]|uniref:Pentatricopeptide repeat-containing protein n=1 Tax=Tetracentron sinense TaxID=13715 RepID=A0A834ZMY0_TETSI|nr:hypothetical protein HHK36_003296 [Tetracentron sinense]
MLNNNIPPDAHTFPSLLKACTSLGLLSHGLLIHQRITITGYSSDAYIACSLLNMYAKFGYTHHARKVFDIMPKRSVVPWTAIINCYSQMGDVDLAFSMYIQMQYEGISPNSVTILSLLSGVSELTQLQCLHACVIRYGFESDLVLVNSLLNVYGRCGRVETACNLFESMDRRDIVSWNSIVSGYAQNGNIRESVELLNRMKTEGTEPDRQTFGFVVSAIATLSKLELGKLVHGQIITAGFESDAHIETALTIMYLKCGNVKDAFRMFEQIPDKDVISWTAMISGLVQNDNVNEALNVFRWMLKLRVMPSTVTISSALAACAQLGSFDQGTSIHGYIVRQRMQVDIAAQNSLITMYAKCGNLKQSWAVFERMGDKDVISWNAIVSGYALNGILDKSLILFNEMKMANQRPDSITVVSILQACASLGALHQGKWIHNFVIKNRVGPRISVDTALIDMYSKCGDINTAQKCFNEMPRQDVISWSTIIAGYGSHGKGETALRLYSEFLRSGIKPNHVTFLSILSACSHSGLVLQGLRIFQSMTQNFGVEPKLEHRACIVDLLSRAGMVQEAYSFFKTMFPEPTIDVLGILLDACRTNRNVELGNVIAGEILNLKPENAENYVQLAHSYASMSRWDGVGEVWTQMRLLGLKKVPGWSFLELHGTITTFFVDHTSHPQYEEIMSMLKILGKEMTHERYPPTQLASQSTLKNLKTDSYKVVSSDGTEVE